MRITGGIHRSRLLRAPRGQTTRPTSDRVREAVFGILSAADRIDGARVLDLYAGSGALAIEALSRGAAEAVLVESSRDALAAIHANLTALELAKQARVLSGDVARLAGRAASEGPFDLVFADPPWALVDDGTALRALSAVVHAGAFVEDACVVLEHSARTNSPDVDGLGPLETRRYGAAALTFYKPAILAPPRTGVFARLPSD